MRGLWGGGVLDLYSGGVSKLMVSAGLRCVAGLDVVLRVETRALGTGYRACSKHCGQTITPSLAISRSLLISSFLPHLGQVQRISSVNS